MNPILTAIVAIALISADSASAQVEASTNPILTSLLEKGVTMSDGTSVKLPSPTMPDGLDANRQKEVLARLADANHPLEELLRRSVVAPFELSVRPVTTPGGKAAARAIDVHFIVYGSQEAMKSYDFLEPLTRLGGGKQAGPESSQSGMLKSEVLAKRGIKISPQPGAEEGLYFATASLFDSVELSATRRILVTRLPESLTIAAMIDPRFNGDPKYPNQWRPMRRDLDDPNKVTFGPPQGYAHAGFYGKITRLAEPNDAMLIEYHAVFEEPEAWFRGANLLSSKLPLVIQDVVRSTRAKLANFAAGKPPN